MRTPYPRACTRFPLLKQGHRAVAFLLRRAPTSVSCLAANGRFLR